MKQIDWPKLITTLVRKHGGQDQLAAALSLDGIPTNGGAFRIRQREKSKSGAVRDRAIWLYLDAQKQGVEIPYKDV